MQIPIPAEDDRDARLTAHHAVAAALNDCGERELGRLVESATPIGTGIGGAVSRLEVAGTPVFVKRVPLTELELLPEHRGSTADLFALPAFCHYGIGGPGFGAWRELAVHRRTTDWVLAGQHEGFPLLHHARVLPGPVQPLPEELADIERAVAYWDGRAEVRHRIEALARASASVVLFLEYLPQTLHSWLGRQLRAGERAADRACVMVERELTATAAFLRARGLLHFDAHFANILTDGRRLYFADYGLALADDFELSQEEAEFVDRHRSYDHCYALTHLVHWLLTELHGGDAAHRRALLRAYTEGTRPAAAPEVIPEAAEAILLRHAPLALVMTEFYRQLQRESRRTPYPVAELRRVLGEGGPLAS